MLFFPGADIPGGHEVIGVGGRLFADVDDNPGQDEPVERDRGYVVAVLGEVNGSVQVGAAVLGGGELFGGVEVAGFRLALDEGLEVEAPGVGGPVERGVVVGVAEVDHVPAGDVVGCDRRRGFLGRRRCAGGGY